MQVLAIHSLLDEISQSWLGDFYILAVIEKIKMSYSAVASILILQDKATLLCIATNCE